MRFTVTKALSVFLAGWALLAGVSAEARDVIISFKDGRTIQGEFISEDSESISISIATIKTSYKKADIKGVQNKLTVDEEYQQKKQALKSTDVEGWYNLAYWLHSQKAFDKSLVEIDALLAAISKPGALKAEEASYLDRAKILRSMVTGEIAKLKAESGKTAPVKPATGATPAATQPASGTGSQSGLQQQYQDRRMTDAQLNMIRLYEIVDPAIERPKVTVKRDALDAFLRDYKDKPDAIRERADMDRFRGAEGWVQLDILFKFKARELYPSVTVHEDPKNMLVFKKSIHNSYVLNYCGTSSCHGGEAGNLFLFNLDPNSNRTVYSNFFNLYTWQDNTGYMINLDVPSDSYLIQYGQPANVKNAMFLAKKPHPEVKGWQPKFRQVQDPVQATIQSWIESLGRTRNDYGIDYIPPVVSPGTKPAQRTFAPVSSSTGSTGGGEQPKKAVPR
jgi:hypothetical protein